MVEGTGQKSIEQGQSIEKSYKPPRDCLVLKLQQADVVQEKCRAHIVAETQQVLPLFKGETLLPNQIADDLGSHGESAQKSNENRIAALIRDAKYPPEYRSIEAVQILKHPRLY